MAPGGKEFGTRCRIRRGTPDAEKGRDARTRAPSKGARGASRYANAGVDLRRWARQYVAVLLDLEGVVLLTRCRHVSAPAPTGNDQLAGEASSASQLALTADAPDPVA